MTVKDIRARINDVGADKLMKEFKYVIRVINGNGYVSL